MKIPENFIEGIDYKINLKIEKFHTQRALDEKCPDEVFNVPGNCLTNKGINLIWKLVAGAPLVSDGTDGRYEWAFTNEKSFIGVGNADDNAPSSTSPIQALATDTMLYAEEHYDITKIERVDCHYCYMGMNDTYPLSGDNQKIVFQSTFLPGVACFNWYEWTIANGNGNRTNAEMENDPYIIRQTAWGIADGNDIDDVAPDPVPQSGTSFEGNTDTARVQKTLLNHRMESMGRKYASATWIITVEVSLS